MFSTHTTGKASSPVLCPGCGTSLDPLRAGHVAILEGGFRYFCGAECKTSFVEGSSRRGMLDALTLDPPRVAARSLADAPVPSGFRSREARAVGAGDPVASAQLANSPIASDLVPSFPVASHPEVTQSVASTSSVSGPSTLRQADIGEEGERPPATLRSENESNGALVGAHARSLDDDESEPDTDVIPMRQRAPYGADAYDDESQLETRPLTRSNGSSDARSDAQLDSSRRVARSQPEDDIVDGAGEGVAAESGPASGTPADANRASEDERVELANLRDDAIDDVDIASAADARRPGTRTLKESVRAHVVAKAPVVGIAFGVLACVVSLAGNGAAAARLPLAVAAATIFAVRCGLRRHEPGEPARLVLLGPVVLGVMGCVLAAWQGDPHAPSHAVYLGLASAAALLIDLLVAHARRDVVFARARVATALAAPVRVVRADVPSQVDASDVKPGEHVIVEKGELVPIDGVVVAGEAEVVPWLDSASVATKRDGDAVVAGASIASGRLRIVATFTSSERAWLKPLQSTGARVDADAPVVAFARRCVERGTPVAGLLVGIAMYASNGSISDVVVAASAGAYALVGLAAVGSASLAHARGQIAAQRRGIVYKDAFAFDAAARTEVAVVCSRGTILLGEPEVVAIEGIVTRPADASERVLALAAGAEMASSDAFASAILHAARARGVRPENVRSALVHSGLGVTGLTATGDKVTVGSRAFLLKERISVAIADGRASELEAQGRTVLLVAVAERVVGLVALQDRLRPGARAAVQRLHDARIEPVLLSGEARETCETIARALDIEHVRPEILPAERGAEVRALADGGRTVGAIGHPACDDGALGAADVSIAMSAAGAAPGEWGVALASDDVRDAALALTVPRACRESARTAALVCAGAHGAAVVGLLFGIAPAAIAPIAALLAAASALAITREPTTLSTSR